MTQASSRTPAAGTDAAPWTTRRLLAWTSEYFQRKGVESPRLCAELLIAHVLGCERLRLYMEVDRPAAPEELSRLRAMVERAGRHEPIQYLLGEAWFFTRPFTVTPDTLIPRPGTERIVERVLQHHRANQDALSQSPTIVDVGTGTGILAITLAASIPSAVVLATDVSAAALEVARVNAARHGVADRIEFRLGSLYEPLLAGAAAPILADYLVSNPPYISDAEWTQVAANVRDYEPSLALRGGMDGLDYLLPLIADAAEALKPGGLALFEIAASQKQAALDLAAANPRLTNIAVLDDHEGLPRVLEATRHED